MNKQREAAGYQTLHLVGWAQPPSYEPKSHTVTWARDIQFAGEEVDTLSYDLRALGRRGVLSLNMIATMPDLPGVRAAADGLRQTAAFEPGSAYEDFDPAVDEAAGYGIAGLIVAGAAGVAAKKLGLLAILALFAKKGAALLLLPLAAFFGRLKRLFIKPKPKATPTLLNETEIDPIAPDEPPMTLDGAAPEDGRPPDQRTA